MTYKEIKDRLTKCEKSLLKIKATSSTAPLSKETKAQVNKLELLKESLIKKLDEAQSKTYLVTPKSGQTTAVSMSDDETDALKDADDVKAIKGIDGEEIKEDKGTIYSVEETKAIAKKVGLACAKGLKSLGDEISHMKAKHIEENSFDIHVEYKKDGKDDTFSFHIQDDNLHLADFSFNKVIGQVGTKPSGEAIVQVDVIANELQKHWKSMMEGMSDDEWADAKEKERLDKHPEKDIIRKIQGLVAKEKSKKLKELTKGISEGPHQTTYVKVSKRDYRKAISIIDQNIDPTYVTTDIVDDDGAGNVIIYFNFREREEGDFDENPGEFIYDLSMDLEAHGITVTEKSHDLDEATDINDPVLMRMRVAKKRNADLKKVDQMHARDRKDQRINGKKRLLIKQLKDKRAEIEREMENDPEIEPQGGPVSDRYGDMLNKIDNAIEKAAGRIKPLDYDTAVGKVSEEDRFAGSDPKAGSTIKGRGFMAPRQKPKVTQQDLNDIEASGNIDIAYKKAMDLLKTMMDRDIKGLDKLSENIPTVYDNESFDALRDIILKYVEDPDDAEAAVQQVDDQGLDSLAPELIANLERDPEFEAWYDKLHNGPSADTDYMQRRKADNDYMEEGEDLDVGHQDDEPHMLKKDLYDVITYASKLYKALDKYDNARGEVDFPHWWQKKVTLAREYMSSAQHYLEGEEKQPAIDQLALESKVNEKGELNESTDLYRDDKFAFTRFSMGKNGPGLQLTDLKKMNEYLHISGKDLDQFIKGLMKAVRVFDDMKRQLPVDEVKAAKVQKAYGLVVAKMKELAKQYKAGDKSVIPQLKDLTAKKKALEADLERAVAGTHRGQELTELSGDQRNDLIELQNILDDVAQKGDEAREIIRQSFPRMLSKADAYGAFDFGSSANRYDTTLESIIEEIEEYYDEEEDDMDEEYKGKHQGSNYKWPMSQATKDRKEADKVSQSQSSSLIGRLGDKNIKEEMDGGQLFDYFKSKGYDITERRPDGYPAKEGVEGYQVSRGSDRSPQSVIFQYNPSTDQFTISQMSGYRIDQKDAIKAGMRKQGRSYTAGQDYYMTDGNYNPVDISAEGLKDIVDHVMTGLDREAKAQSDFYKDRGHTSGTIDEKSVSENIDIKKASTDKLEKILKQSEDEKVSPAFASQLKLIRKELQNRKKNLQEEATCCGRCGRVHVKGSGCKRPYLKGKKHCRTK